MTGATNANAAAAVALDGLAYQPEVPLQKPRIPAPCRVRGGQLGGGRLFGAIVEKEEWLFDAQFRGGAEQRSRHIDACAEARVAPARLRGHRAAERESENSQAARVAPSREAFELAHNQFDILDPVPQQPFVGFEGTPQG